MEAIAMTVARGRKLKKMSRINFEKIHTIKHNRLVRNIGVIAKDTRSFDLLVSRFEASVLSHLHYASSARDEEQGEIPDPARVKAAHTI